MKPIAHAMLPSTKVEKIKSNKGCCYPALHSLQSRGDLNIEKPSRDGDELNLVSQSSISKTVSFTLYKLYTQI